jgi:hypothetical protein
MALLVILQAAFVLAAFVRQVEGLVYKTMI